MSLKDRALKGSVFNTLRSVIESALGIVSFLVFARLLQPETFGLYAIAAAIVATVKTVNDLGFMRALVQRDDLTEGHRSTAFWTVLAVSLLLALLVSCTAWIFRLIFKEPTLSLILPVMSLGLLFQGYSFSSKGLLMRDLHFDFIAYCSLAGSLVGTIVGILMAYYGLGVWSLVGYRLTISLVGSLGYFLGPSWRPSFLFDLEKFFDLLDYGKTIAGRNFLNRLGGRLDDLIIGYVLGSSLLGYYTIAYRIMHLTGQLLVGSLSNVAMPLYSRLQTETDRLKRAFTTSLRLVSAVAFPVYASIIVLADSVVVLLFGSKWQPSVPILRILLLSGIAVVLLKFMVVLMEALNRPDYDLYLTLVESVLVGVLFAVLAQFGLRVVAWTFVGIKTAMAPVAVVLAIGLIELAPKRILDAVIHPFLGACVMVAGLELLTGVGFVVESPVGDVFLRAFICLLLYVFYLLMMAPDLLRELLGFVKRVLTGGDFDLA